MHTFFQGIKVNHCHTRTWINVSFVSFSFRSFISLRVIYFFVKYTTFSPSSTTLTNFCFSIRCHLNHFKNKKKLCILKLEKKIKSNFKNLKELKTYVIVSFRSLVFKNMLWQVNRWISVSWRPTLALKLHVINEELDKK